MARPRCVLCGEQIIGTKSACRRVVDGWVPQRSEGGGHNVRLAVLTDWACKVCVYELVLRAKRGISPDQSRWEF